MIAELYERSEDWLKYAIQVNLLHTPKNETIELREAALADVKIQGLLKNISDFHGVLVSNHRNPVLPIHSLLFLLDIGFDTDIPEISLAIDSVLEHKDVNGVYQSMLNIPKHFGGTGIDSFSWCLCDGPLLLLALLKAGIDYQSHLRNGIEYLVSLCRDNGFPCAVSPEIGKFRGPGKKSECCPYATLIMADLLSYIPEHHDSLAANASINSLLNLWENSLEQHPYMFYMGTDFRKLKAPSCWYDIVSVADVLSKYHNVHADPRFIEMINLIKLKQDNEGFFIPESQYVKLNGWDFSQKKASSPYLTYLCLRIFERINTDNDVEISS